MLTKYGFEFENQINNTLKHYRAKKIALIYKRPVAMQIIPGSSNKQSRDHNKYFSYFQNKSTVDFIGVFKGHFIAFEAKATSKSSFPHQNLRQHQEKFLSEATKQKGICFLLILFVKENKVFAITYSAISAYWKTAKRKTAVPRSYFQKNGVELTWRVTDKTLDLLKVLNALIP